MNAADAEHVDRLERMQFSSISRASVTPTVSRRTFGLASTGIGMLPVTACGTAEGASAPGCVGRQNGR